MFIHLHQLEGMEWDLKIMLLTQSGIKASIMVFLHSLS
jgi:hypothetical protein